MSTVEDFGDIAFFNLVVKTVPFQIFIRTSFIFPETTGR